MLQDMFKNSGPSQGTCVARDAVRRCAGAA